MLGTTTSVSRFMRLFNYRRCVACSGALGAVITSGGGRFAGCDECGGLHGEGTREAVRSVVNFGAFHDGDSTAGETYFDFTYTDGDTRRRVHGWYDNRSKRVTQFG